MRKGTRMIGIQEIMRLTSAPVSVFADRQDPRVRLSKRIVGIKNVTINEPFFQGHFPGHPIMPGVLLLEAMAQTGGVLALKSFRRRRLRRRSSIS